MTKFHGKYVIGDGDTCGFLRPNRIARILCCIWSHRNRLIHREIMTNDLQFVINILKTNLGAISGGIDWLYGPFITSSFSNNVKMSGNT